MCAAVTRVRLDTDQRREQLLRVGIELFGTQPPETLSLGVIARTAGVSKGLLYHYFRDKEQYLLAVLQVAGRELVEATEPDPSLPLMEMIEGAIDGLVTFAEKHAAGYISIFRGDLVIPGFGDVIRSWRERRISGFVEHIARISPADPEVVRSSQVLKIVLDGQITSIETSVMRWLEHPEIERAQLLRLLATAFLMAMVAAHSIEPELRLDAVGKP